MTVEIFHDYCVGIFHKCEDFPRMCNLTLITTISQSPPNFDLLSCLATRELNRVQDLRKLRKPQKVHKLHVLSQAPKKRILIVVLKIQL